MVEGAQLLYVGTAYAVAGLVLAGLVLRAVLDHRAQARALAELDGAGWRRGPAPRPAAPESALPAEASKP